MNEKEFYITDDGLRLHAKLDRPETEEKVPLMLLFHGFTGHMEEEHIVAVMETAVQENIAVLRVELYGHGGSDGAFEDHTLYKWVSNGLKVIDYARQLDFVTELYLCGHSQGGLLVTLLAGMCPDACRALIPMSPALMIPEMARKGSLLGFPFDPQVIPEYLDCWDERKLRGDYARVAQTIHVEDEIARYHGPVCLIHGDADSAVPYDCSVKAAAQYENAQLRTIAGADHCYGGYLEELCAALRGFLREVKAEGKQ